VDDGAAGGVAGGLPVRVVQRRPRSRRVHRRYRHRLHRQTPRILAELQELREGYGDLVLPCFEPPDRFCHRVLSTWLEEKLGEFVEEVMPAPTL